MFGCDSLAAASTSRWNRFTVDDGVDWVASSFMATASTGPTQKTASHITSVFFQGVGREKSASAETKQRPSI
jgi:hypothetical protein